jgi:hypothetical protein
MQARMQPQASRFCFGRPQKYKKLKGCFKVIFTLYAHGDSPLHLLLLLRCNCYCCASGRSLHVLCIEHTAVICCCKIAVCSLLQAAQEDRAAVSTATVEPAEQPASKPQHTSARNDQAEFIQRLRQEAFEVSRHQTGQHGFAVGQAIE